MPDEVLDDLRRRLEHTRWPDVIPWHGLALRLRPGLRAGARRLLLREFDWRAQERLLVPSLPGFGCSGPTAVSGVDVARIAKIFVRLMQSLGYERFVAQGGDWGSYVTTTLGRAWHSQVAAIHLNTHPGFLISSVASDEEKVMVKERAEKMWLSKRGHAAIDDGGYAEILGTRPQTIAYALNDSPSGLAAWITEKFYAWSDCHGKLEDVFTKDELLTDIMLYWVSQTGNSSGRLYYETRHGDPDVFNGRVEAPTALAIFPAEGSPPRAFVERIYNLARWTEMHEGGHFAAVEQPAALVETYGPSSGLIVRNWPANPR